MEQVEAVTSVVPDDFKMDLDFNMTLCNAASALPVLRRLADYPNVAMVESPIPQDDIHGNKVAAASANILLISAVCAIWMIVPCISRQ